MDAHVPVRIESVADRIRESSLNERTIAMLGSWLGAAALVLAAAGLYGLLAYTVSRHTRDIGVRLALGARRGSVLWMIQRESLALAAAGVAAGLGAALALGRVIDADLLFQITPSDPTALGLAATIMLGVAAAAGYLPARRAANLDPATALKSDG
jgi:ABC-type antimicrobial peptide transport system permease subunit